MEFTEFLNLCVSKRKKIIGSTVKSCGHTSFTMNRSGYWVVQWWRLRPLSWRSGNGATAKNHLMGEWVFCHPSVTDAIHDLYPGPVRTVSGFQKFFRSPEVNRLIDGVNTLFSWLCNILRLDHMEPDLKRNKSKVNNLLYVKVKRI